MPFFTADTHFGHAGARALYRRPFASVAEMDAAIVARWNAVVGPNDEVWHLGDFAVRHPDPGAVLAALHGRKHLITGNNDPPAVTSLLAGRRCSPIWSCRWTVPRWCCATTPSAPGAAWPRAR